MEFKAAKCPNCGGELQLPDNRETVKCMYCGGEVVVQKAIRDYAPQVNIDNLLELADKALEAGNFEEGNQYYSKVLEFDPKHFKAWLGKGVATGFLVNVYKFNLDESLVYFQNSIKNAPEGETEEVLFQVGRAINNICKCAYMLTMNDIVNQTNFDYEAYCNRVRLIIHYFVISTTFAPKEITIYKNVLFIIKNFLKYYQKGTNYYEYNDIIKELIKRARENNPDYDISSDEDFSEFDFTENQKNSSNPDNKNQPCYIATAVYGDFNASPVLTLRHYRNEVLMNTKFGRLLVRFYYYLSPCFVRWMKGKSHINQFVKRILDQVVQTIESRHRL